MKKLAILFSLCLAFPLFAKTPTPVGTWMTYDDETKEPESLVRIYKVKGKNIYNGKIYKSLAPNPTGPSTCENCPEPFTGKKIQGLEFLWGFKRSEENPLQYVNGHVLDPRNGSVYNAKMTVSEDGKTLNFRGYMGISLFGGSRTWTRVEKQPNEQ